METFSNFVYKRPDLDALAKDFEIALERFTSAESIDSQREALAQLNVLRKSFESMRDLAHVRFTHDTRDTFYKEENDFFNEESPRYEGLVSALYNALLKARFKDGLIAEFGDHIFRLSEKAINVYAPEIEEDLKEENRLRSEYTSLLASAEVMFKGKKHNLSMMGVYMSSPDRQLRKEASNARWSFLHERQDEFDRLFDELVKVRTRMAKKLGYDNFVQLGYDRLSRTEYGPAEIKAFRAQIAEHVVPLASSMRDRQQHRLGLDSLNHYDEPLLFPDGNPQPLGDPRWIIDRGQEMYNKLSQETGDFYRFMDERELMDLETRPGKAPGGYCTYLDNFEVPYIFANFNGTKGDIFVLTHEAGHAFQVYSSRGQEVPEYQWPTMEACEIHSMSMEFFTRPYMDLFFEEKADQYRYAHLFEAIAFLPYGAAIDEFQHVVYEQPELSPAERRAAWRDIERKYLPHRDYDGNDYLELGGFWQAQRHIFKMPFYYIDYVLAQLCAFQFWFKAIDNHDQAFADYVKLCKAGGTMPFLSLVDYAGLKSPFDNSVIKSVVERLSQEIAKVDSEISVTA
ncbi:MAG: M3 family oligoendopeptidase [Bacteroidia bacterium]